VARASGHRRRAREEDGGSLFIASAKLRLVRSQGRALERLVGELAEHTHDAYALVKQLAPSESTVVHTLPHPWLTLRTATTLTLMCIRGVRWRATLPELGLESGGASREKAIRGVLKALVTLYQELQADSSQDAERWQMVQQLVMAIDPGTVDPNPARRRLQVPATVPDLAEWVSSNTPADLDDAEATAWNRGARACFVGRRTCTYRAPAYVAAWKAGFSSMRDYLELGGRIACAMCRRPSAGASEGRPGSASERMAVQS
jgi:hypothetical protein